MSFYSILSRYYRNIFPTSEKFVNAIEELIGIPPKKIIDVGCASGELTQLLLQDAYEAFGIDSEKDMIRVAAGNILEEYKNRYLHMSMLEISGHFDDNSFDSVLCLGNTIVHLTNIEYITNFIKQAGTILKTGGILILQLLNYDFIFSENITELPVIENNFFQFYRSYQLDNDNNEVNFNTTLIDRNLGTVYENTSRLYPLRKNELISLLEKHGFTQIDAYRSVHKEKYLDKSMQLVVVARNS